MTLQLIVSASIWGVRENEFLYPLFIALSFTCEGGHFSMYPTVTAKIFGIQFGGQIFTIMFFAISVSSTVGFIVAHNIDDSQLDVVFYISAGLTLINIVLLYFLDEHEMLSKSTKDKIESGYTVKLGNKRLINASGVTE